MPNPLLDPEVGKTKEAGVNFKFDDIFSKGDAFRAKLSAYRNDVDDYIEQNFIPLGGTGVGGIVCVGAAPPTPFCLQYQNIAHARLEGVEFESVYDNGIWLGGLAASHVRGWNAGTNAPLATVPPDSMTLTAGHRFFERKLTVALRWQAFDAKKASDIPVTTSGSPAFLPTPAYSLVNVYAGYQFNPDVLATFAIENLFDEQYAPYTSEYPISGPPGTPSSLGIPGPGITIKAALKVRFGDDFFRKGPG
jgi:hemoglobin/transferrin/lactoferrin receptor protein